MKFNLIETMNTIPTAEEFKEREYNNIYWDENSAMVFAIEFAKFHVEAALKEASKKALADFDEGGATGFVDEESILNSYPLTNIK